MSTKQITAVLGASVLIGLVVLIGVVLFNRRNADQPKSTLPTPVLIVEDPNLISNTITNNKCTSKFSYDKTLFIEETDPNFFVFTKNEDTLPYLSNISLDGRGKGSYSDFDAATQTTRSTWSDVVEESLPNGVLFKGKVPPGFREGQQIEHFYMKCNGSAIVVEWTPGEVPHDVFVQIINSLKTI